MLNLDDFLLKSEDLPSFFLSLQHKTKNKSFK